MKFLHMHNILKLIITNFVVWSWALEKHPEIQHVSMEFV
jgi:hypothetical protein